MIFLGSQKNTLRTSLTVFLPISLEIKELEGHSFVLKSCDILNVLVVPICPESKCNKSSIYQC